MKIIEASSKDLLLRKRRQSGTKKLSTMNPDFENSDERQHDEISKAEECAYPDKSKKAFDEGRGTRWENMMINRIMKTRRVNPRSPRKTVPWTWRKKNKEKTVNMMNKTRLKTLRRQIERPNRNSLYQILQSRHSCL